MAFPWGPLISAGGSILGGLFGGGDKGPSFGDQKSWMREQMMSKIKWTVDDAKRSGIHPLVALGSPASSGFASPVGGGGAGGFGWADAAGAGLSALGDLYEQDQDRMERDKDRAERASARDDRRFRQIIQDQLASKRDDQALKESNARIAEHMSNVALNAARMKSIGAAAAVNEVTGPNSILPGGLGVLPTGAATDAQEIEDRYGGLSGEVFGFGKLLDDIISDAARKKWFDVPKWFDEKRAANPSQHHGHILRKRGF